MNGFVISKSRWIVIVVCAILWVGCKKETATAPPVAGNEGQVEPRAIQTGPDGEAIIRDLVTTYSNATSYSDQAVLYLSYRLHGQSIQEPQRWSTAWDRTGRLAAQLFNGHVRCDGGLLSCYVYDIESANLDNQHLLIPYDNQLPIRQLFRDSIAKHFLGGYSELPLDETDLVSAAKLVPAPISLLTNQNRNGWLQNPSQVERLADQVFNGSACYVVRCLAQGMTADVWIDQRTKTLVQMSLPLKLLAGEVITSPEITDVVLVAKFHNAVLDGPVTDEMFAIEPRPDATPVLRFVALPEPFPSELIGKTAPDFNLITAEGKLRDLLFFDGKVTAFLWLGGRASYSAIGRLETLTADLPAERFHIASIYSDSELKTPGSGSREPVEGLDSAMKQASIPIYYDPQLVASSSLRVKTIPSVIVMDGDSRIQYAKSLSDKSWLTDVKAALQRVDAGDDVAAEMQQEYDRFLDSYRQQLVTVSAVDLIDAPQPESVSQVSLGHGHSRQRMRLRPEKTWTNQEFKQSGNVVVLDPVVDNQAALLIFDGWRTVAQVDSTSGQILSRVELKLPAGEAANLIRSGTLPNRERLFAVFSELGEQVFLFDGDWNPIGTYPDNDLEHQGIRDCRVSDLDGNGVSELIVAFDDKNGVHLVDPDTRAGEQISTVAAESVVSLEDEIVITAEGKIGILKTGLTNVEETELQFHRVGALGKEFLGGIGMTENGQWNVVGFDKALNRVWTLSIGPQFFETGIEPIAVARADSSEIIWAIADSEDAIHLVSGSGKWLGDFQSESRLSGIALSAQAGRTSLIVSNAEGVECWNLNLQPNPMRPASTKK